MPRPYDYDACIALFVQKNEYPNSKPLEKNLLYLHSKHKKRLRCEIFLKLLKNRILEK